MKTMSLVTVFAVLFGLSAFGLPDADGVLGTPAAHAKSEKGDRGNNGRGRGAGGDFSAEVAGRGLGGRAGIAADGEVETKGRGHIARELKSMNAANAFKNGNVPNASPTSNVGQIAAYREALLGNQALVDQYGSPEELDAAMTEALGELSANGVDLSLIDDTNTVASLSAETVTALEGDLATLDPTTDEYAATQAQIDAINAAAGAYAEAQADLASLEDGMLDGSASFEAASGGRPRESFSEKALAAFHDLLGIGD